MKRNFYLAALAAFTIASIGSSYAAKSAENDALAIATAKISLTQAVTAAEQHTGGKCARAEYERHKGQWVYDVEVVQNTKVMDVKVDPTSGTIISATEDKADRDDEHDKAD
jgi:uncharacterized membrane protein YkoI